MEGVHAGDSAQGEEHGLGTGGVETFGFVFSDKGVEAFADQPSIACRAVFSTKTNALSFEIIVDKENISVIFPC